MSSRPPFVDDDDDPGLPEQGPAARWAESVRRELDEHAEALDAATRSRLNRARQSALIEAEREAARPRWWSWSARPLRVLLPAGVAAALALAVALHPTMLERGGNEPAPAAAVVEDLQLIQQSESLELFEDQEFYAWLDESEPSPG